MTTPSNHSTLWLLSRVDQHCREAVEDLLNKVTEKISTATGDAVSIRMLSGDGQSLIPLAAHHPDLYRAAAMAAVMGETVQPVTSGLWQTVVNTRRPARWHVPPGSPAPVEASPAQVEFFRRFPLRAVLAAPLLLDDRLVGGVSVVRFGTDKPFTDDDESMLSACARRLAPVVDLQRTIEEAIGGRRAVADSAIPEDRSS